MTLMLIQAMDFAARAHKEQTRKVDDSPYINHLLEVCNILRYAGFKDERLLTVAILHDVIEDTHATKEQLSFLFGDDVAQRVEQLSDDKSLSIEKRKQAVKRQLATGQVDYIAVKLADLISNISSIPNSWDEVKIDSYLSQCADMLSSIPTKVGAKLQPLLDLAKYVLNAQKNGLTIYDELCELARQGSLFWCAIHRTLIATDYVSNGQFEGYCISGDFNIMFQLGLLRSLQIGGSSAINVRVVYSVDEGFNEPSFDEHHKFMTAINVTLTH
jgi:guanosine-3',5'-bis(diphosphate) 3'-pyrophosphohydrolase